MNRLKRLFTKVNEKIREDIKENNTKGIEVALAYIIAYIGLFMGVIIGCTNAVRLSMKTRRIVKRVVKERLNKILVSQEILNMIAKEFEEEMAEYLSDSILMNVKKFDDHKVERLVNNIINRNIY